MSCGDIFLGLIAVIFPPIAVWIKSGICSADSFINILLCMLGFIPGLLHAWYIIARNPEINHDYEPIGQAEEGRVTYYYVDHDGPQRGYGTQQNRQGAGGASRAAPALPPAAGGQQRLLPAPPINKSSKPKPQQSHPSTQTGGSSSAATRDEDSTAPPPSYSEVVRGDNKVQTP